MLPNEFLSKIIKEALSCVIQENSKNEIIFIYLDLMSTLNILPNVVHDVSSLIEALTCYLNYTDQSTQNQQHSQLLLSALQLKAK